MSFADEFPNDNPELFALRPLTALHLAAIHLIDVEPATIEVEAVAIEVDPRADLEASPPEQPTFEPPIEPPVEPEAFDIEVVDAFDEADFEHATLESILPPPPGPCEAEHASISEAARAEVLIGADGDSILDPPSEPEPDLQPLSGAEPTSEPDYVSLWTNTLRDVAIAHGASVDAVTSMSTELATDPVAQAWRVAIMGGEADFSACGQQTLDEWSAHLVARLANAPTKFESIRRELRGRGVCAFGLVVEAA